MVNSAYYLVPCGSKSHEKIAQFIKDRRNAAKRRMQFVQDCFPDQKMAGWKISYGHSYHWAVVPPLGVKMPPGWRQVDSGPGWVPCQSRRRDKALWDAMHAPALYMPGRSDLAGSLGIITRLEVVDGDLVIYTVRASKAAGRAFVIELHPQQRAPRDCERISDIECERITKRHKRVV